MRAAALALVALASTAQAAAPVGWKTHTNAKDGYSLSYPADWRLDADFYDGLPGDAAAPQGVSVTAPDSLKQGSNFDNAMFSVERLPGRACTPDRFYSGVSAAFGNVHTTRADGRTYTGGESRSVDSGDTYVNAVFVVDGLSRCIAVRYFWRINDMKRYVPGEAKPFDESGLRRTMDRIRATLTFKK